MEEKKTKDDLFGWSLVISFKIFKITTVFSFSFFLKKFWYQNKFYFNFFYSIKISWKLIQEKQGREVQKQWRCGREEKQEIQRLKAEENKRLKQRFREGKQEARDKVLGFREGKRLDFLYLSARTEFCWAKLKLWDFKFLPKSISVKSLSRIR